MKFEFIPMLSEPGAVSNCCFVNVMHKVNNDGGRMRFGWKIFDVLNSLYSTFHAIWVSPSGDSFDVTPDTRIDGAVLFVAQSEQENRLSNYYVRRAILSRQKGLKISVPLGKSITNYYGGFNGINQATDSGMV